jgi:hypothetical protein
MLDPKYGSESEILGRALVEPQPLDGLRSELSAKVLQEVNLGESLVELLPRYLPSREYPPMLHD